MNIMKENNAVNITHENEDNLFLELNEKFKKIEKMGWIKGNRKNRGSVGIIFEELLGNTFNNFQLPDYQGIEIKTKSSRKEKYITLFSATPDSFLYEIKRIVDTYGYPDTQFPQFNIFNTDINTFKYNKVKSNFFVKLGVDDNDKNIILNIYDQKCNLIDSDSKWSFELLQEKLERKLKYLAFIKVEKKFSHNELYFKYSAIEFYKLKDFETFMSLIKKGIIRIVFRIGIYKNEKKFGQIYDHGSAFCIKVENLEMLFQKVNID